MKNTKKRILRKQPQANKKQKLSSFSSEQGLLTVEAALALGIFLVAFLSWILVLQLIKIQSITQESLDQTALSYSDRLTFQACLGKNLPGLEKFFQEAEGKEGPGPQDFKDLLKESMDQADINFLYQNYVHGGKGQILHLDPWNRWVGGSQIEKEVNPKENRFTLKLHYSLKLPGIFKDLGPIEIAQNSSAGLWLLEEGLVEETEKKENTLWNLPPVQRGSAFAQRQKEKFQGKTLEKGQVFDYISSEGNPTSIYSLNLFRSTYSSGQGKKADQYTLKENSILSKLRSYAQIVKKAQKDYPQVRMEDGTLLNIQQKKPAIQMIFPEEAKIFENQLILLCQQIQNEEGVLMEFSFQDQALQNQEGDSKI